MVQTLKLLAARNSSLVEINRATEPSVYYKAEAFHITAKILHENTELTYRGAPFIVNAAFSIELYIKCLMSKTIFEGPETHKEGYTSYERVYSKSTNTSQGHNLDNLYQQLPEKTRLKLEEINQKLNGKKTLAEFFNQNKYHFVSWRYSFEGNAKPYCAEHVLQVLNALKSYASEHVAQS